MLIIFILFFNFIPWTIKAQELKVAFAKWPPWKIINQNHFKGIDARIVRSISKRLGFSIKFVQCPWPRCVDMVKSGEADLITSFGKTQERGEYVYYLGPPYIVEQLSFWIRKDSDISIQTYEDLYGKNIGTIKGSIYFSKFDQDQKLSKTIVNLEVQTFKMLSNNRIDTFIGYETVIDYLLLIEGFKKKFKKVRFQQPGSGSHIAMSKRSKGLVWRSVIGQTIQEMTRNGELRQIIDDFLLDVAKKVAPREK